VRKFEWNKTVMDATRPATAPFLPRRIPATKYKEPMEPRITRL
jgi:hypothetical protein